MIPKTIQESHVLQAIEKIDAEGIVYPLTKSKKYDLVYNSKTYPPKLVISLANEFANGEYLSHKKFNTYEAQHYLQELSTDFVISEKGPNVVDNIMDRYKKLLVETGIDDELYKWKLVKRLKRRPAVDASDFATEIKEVVSPTENNMLYQMAKATANRIATRKPEEYRACFRKLFDETIPLQQRITNFQSETTALYKSTEGQHSAHHDERTISVFLTFHNPDKYTFYKSTYYEEYCKVLGIKPKYAGEKYVHYLELIQDLADNYIQEDKKLLGLADSKLTDVECYEDENRLLLAQDILYQLFQMPIKNILVNISWNSNNWQGVSDDKSNHKWVAEGGIPHESWNFDFDNIRNTTENIYGYCKFTKPPKVQEDNNLVIYYSQNQIIGFYGKATILGDTVYVNENESYNIVGSRPLCILLENKITNVKEKGYLEDKQRVGQIGFNYLEQPETIAKIIQEAIFLNPDMENQLNDLRDWLHLPRVYHPNYWVFQASPKIYNIKDALNAGVLKKWAVNQYKNEIRIGDKVIIWLSGGDAGIYALATVSSPVHLGGDEEEETPFYINNTDTGVELLVNLKMDYNLIKEPILKAKVLSHPGLNDIQQGRQGTNFKATETQYNAILKLIHMKNNDNKQALNQILFGPPGTGKTYNTVNESLKIVDPEYYAEHSDNREALTKRFRELIIKDWENPKGQIAFCTFHQSFSYEDFVEGIKPKTEKTEKKVYYEVEDGVFKNICRLGDSNESIIKVIKEGKIAWDEAFFKKASFYKVSLGEAKNPADRIIYEYCRDNGYIAIGFAQGYNFTGMTETQIQEKCAEIGFKGMEAQLLNYFKNYMKIGNYVLVSNGNKYVRAIGKVVGEYEYKDDVPFDFNHFRKVEWIFTDENVPVEEIYDRQLSQVTLYKIDQNGLNQNFFTNKGREESIEKKEKKKYVLIVDEINRGNVSSIFGELITLIEKDKRSGGREELEVTLPYSKTPFKVPENVYIIGTMNTADRSIEALDTALRRRFSFKEMPPKPELIKSKGASLELTDGKIDEIDVIKLLETINARIEKLIDKDHKIGHSYFMHISTKEDLIKAFEDKVIPLLEEYFFGDFGKIGLVLGNSFVAKDESDDFEFAGFDGYSNQVQDLKERPVYKILPSTQWDFVTIYQSKM